MSDVKGKIVAITGASSGIGAAAGRLLAASGAFRANFDDNNDVGLED
jgi:NAD(P)-dependent dehydrogenase (short-subunit alcohol dehydrogenase family)